MEELGKAEKVRGNVQFDIRANSRAGVSRRIASLQPAAEIPVQRAVLRDRLQDCAASKHGVHRHRKLQQLQLRYANRGGDAAQQIPRLRAAPADKIPENCATLGQSILQD